VKVRLLHQAGTGDPERAWSASILWSDKPATEEMRNSRASRSSSPAAAASHKSAPRSGEEGDRSGRPGGRSPRSRPWSTGMSGRSVPSVTARWPKPLLLTVAQPIAKGAGYFEPAPGRSPVVVWPIDGASLQADNPAVSGRRSQDGRSARGGSTMPRFAYGSLRRRRSSSRATSPAAPPTLDWALRWSDRRRCRNFDRGGSWSFGPTRPACCPGRSTPRARPRGLAGP
jgi:hypothetical protein